MNANKEVNIIPELNEKQKQNPYSYRQQKNIPFTPPILGAFAKLYQRGTYILEPKAARNQPTCTTQTKIKIKTFTKKPQKIKNKKFCER
jgi:hypothetical protein